MNKWDYLYAKCCSLSWCALRKVIGVRKFKRYKYFGKKIHGYDQASDIIYEKIVSGEPFLAARFGDAELRTLVYTIECNLGLRSSFPDYIKLAMHRNAGFFPADDINLAKFGDLVWDAAKEVDVFGVWYNLLEDYVIYNQNKDASLVELEGLEPYRSVNPWSRALKGKKVLVVHPFEESIKYQYHKRDKLFKDSNVLPEFELITYKAIQTNAGASCEYKTWFDALEKMYSDIKVLDFDVAIVGCGAYGLPLSAMIKKLNKQ